MSLIHILTSLRTLLKTGTILILPLLHPLSVFADTKIFVVGEPSLTYYSANPDSDSGRAAGQDAVFFQALLTEQGYRPQLDVYPWSRAYRIATQTPNTLIIGIARNPERKDKLYWVEAFMDLQYGLFSYGDKPRFNIQSAKELQQFTIGAQRDDGLYHVLVAMGLKKIETVLHYHMLYKMAEKQRVDLITASTETTDIRCRQLAICDKLHMEYPLTHVDNTLYLAFNKDTDSNLVQSVREAFQHKVMSGQYQQQFPKRKVTLQFPK